MPLLRLMGLVLFVTTLFLTLAAATTQTTEIRFKRPDRWSQPQPPNSGVPPQATGQSVEQPQLEFVIVPIVWPLAVAAGAGLLLWFGPALSVSSAPPRRRRRRRTRR